MSSTYRYEAMASTSVVPAFGGHTGQGRTATVFGSLSCIEGTDYVVKPTATRTDGPPGPPL